jgi:hypothetical protein
MIIEIAVKIFGFIIYDGNILKIFQNKWLT